LGQSQILPYLGRLAKLENDITVISFEKPDLFLKHEPLIRKLVQEASITWIPLSYTKEPPVLSTILDINKGFTKARHLHDKRPFHIVHCRGYISAIIGRKLKNRFEIPFIFDMRGWWADEKLESGFWNSKIYKPVYNYFKRLEKAFFAESDVVVSLTYKGKEEIVQHGWAASEKVGVIPTCVDFEIFKPRSNSTRDAVRSKLGAGPHDMIFIYSGSVGGNYDEQTLIGVFKAFEKLHPGSFLLILSKEPLSLHIRAAFEQAGIYRMQVIHAAFREVSDYLVAADVGFIYYKLTYSTIGRSPTKLGEYWASNLPLISFKGIGDLDNIISQFPKSGVLLSEDPSQWEEELKVIPFDFSSSLRQYSMEYFHINKGVAFYQKLYQQLKPI
jgi:glycosyltransferase involved in cell wall biosynthesis